MSLSASSAVVWSGAAATVVFLAAWVRQLRTRDATSVDLLWTLGVGAVALFHAVVGDGWGPRRALVAALAVLWAARLALHLVPRLARSAGEDERYAELRRRLGARAPAWMLLWYVAQAALVVALGLVFLVLSRAEAAGWRARRRGIRGLLRARLREEERRHAERERALGEWADAMRRAPVAPLPEKANEQHYEVPSELFELVLGPRMKYSSAWYDASTRDLAEAEEAMLALTALRADLADGQDVLELGCGWGSLTLWMAERFPRSRILAVSNSASQRELVLERARARGLANVDVETRDMNAFDTGRRFDRVVSVEMFEHMRNWEELLRRVARWLRPDGRLFLHVFAHRSYAYPFEVRDASDWMSAHFFSGGMMPSADLVDHLRTPFETEGRWHVPGTHYARTAEAWLANLERERTRVLAVLERVHGADAPRWYQRWRLFFLACAELFAYRGGEEWLVVHQRLRLAGGSA